MRTFLLALSSWLLVSTATAIELDSARDHDPKLDPDETGAVVAKFHPRLKALWLEALARPEADLKRQAADAIVRAHRLGMPGLQEVVPRLLAELEAPDAHPVVRLAVARALIALDARQAAPALMKRSRTGGFDAARLIEPALAGWDHAPMRPVWLDRLKDARTSRGPLTLAIRAAATVKLVEAVSHLRRLGLDPTAAGDIRLEAARAVGTLQSSGLEEDARPLAADASPSKVLDRLVAASLLAHHRGQTAEALLLRLGSDGEPAVATVAVRRLFEIDPARPAPLLAGLVKSPDAGLRQLAARSLAELRTPEAVALLAPLLDDPHRELRVFAREALIRLADVEALRGAVRRAVMQVLTAAGPRGREQAAAVVGALRHEPAAARLLQLLDDDAARVRVAAAWALRRLAVPATASALLERVRKETDRVRSPAPAEPALDETFRVLEHLIEALGVLHFQPASPLLKKYLPPPPMPPPPGVVNPLWQPQLRTAAIWALGHIHAADAKNMGPNKGPESLARSLEERLVGEGGLVGAIAAVSLGRLKAKEYVPLFRQRYGNDKESLAVRRACAWALEQITGETLPVLTVPPRKIRYGNWFLEPLDESA
jgi:HEAT repeat protein